jgi:hypothetical protein
MAKRKRNSTSWAACKAAIKNWPAPGLRELIHELYQLSDDNRRFPHGRLLPQAAAQTLGEATAALKRLTSVSSVWNDEFRHADAKRVVDQFAKATDDKAAVAQLLLADLEMSFKTFSEVGDFEPMVDHLYASLNRLDKLLSAVPAATLPPLVQRLVDIAARWGADFGYGISDELSGVAADWRQRVDDPQSEVG